MVSNAGTVRPGKSAATAPRARGTDPRSDEIERFLAQDGLTQSVRDDPRRQARAESACSLLLPSAYPEERAISTGRRHRSGRGTGAHRGKTGSGDALEQRLGAALDVIRRAPGCQGSSRIANRVARLVHVGDHLDVSRSAHAFRASEDAPRWRSHVADVFESAKQLGHFEAKHTL